jgi:uncharacterized repeat protein (TIGR03833 family)
MPKDRPLVGSVVRIVLKERQRLHREVGDSVLIEGVVQRILTKSNKHPHGFKVQLTDGQVGRVKIIVQLHPSAA